MNFPASCGFRIIGGTTLGGSSISGVLHGKIIVICSKGFDTNGAIHVVRALVGYKPDITYVKNIFCFMAKHAYPFNVGVIISELRNRPRSGLQEYL